METFPTRIDGNWRVVKENNHVIGDFAWTGWDYLDEVGIGHQQTLENLAPSTPPSSRCRRPGAPAPGRAGRGGGRWTQPEPLAAGSKMAADST
ncbi:hypothetical protein [Streptomyces chartreusis]|uniref:hypothetical protein n=1 Tax=Streptomyces chartreusis TaxID=1969 RepID=UPI0033B249B5